MRISGRLHTLLWLTILCLPARPAGQEVSEYEKRLDRLAAQIQALKGTIKREQTRKSDLLSRLGQIGLRKRVIQNELEMIVTQREKAQAEKQLLEGRIPELRDRLERENQTIARILVGIYKFGRLNSTGLLLQADRIGDLITEHKQLSVLAKHQERIISGYMDTLNQLREAQTRLQERRRTIEQSLISTREKQQELRLQETEYRNLARSIDQDLAAHTTALQEQKERAEQLQTLIKKLLEDQTSLSFPLIPMYEHKGRLPWPVSGKVISRFGNQRHPRFNTVTKNNGIEIDPGQTMIVKAVHPGAVVFADYIDGYGYLVILDHGMAYYSLYGHCSPEFLVHKGDAVRQEQPIAYVADIGSLKGTSLYFEIRHKSEALDPLQWLKRR